MTKRLCLCHRYETDSSFRLIRGLLAVSGILLMIDTVGSRLLPFTYLISNQAFLRRIIAS